MRDLRDRFRARVEGADSTSLKERKKTPPDTPCVGAPDGALWSTESQVNSAAGCVLEAVNR